MQNPALDQFAHALQAQIIRVTLLGALAVLVIGLPLAYLRIKAERKLIEWIRGRRAKNAAGTGAATVQTRSAVGLEPITLNERGSLHCPVCNAQMVRRTARRGANAGSEFYGCSNYPKCRGTRGI